MPQMKPMNWLILFMLLNLILIFMNIMNYYKNFNFNMLMKKKNNKLNFKNWMW